MAGENINRKLNIYINDREVVNSMRGVGSEMARVRNEMRNLNAGADNYNQRLAELRSTYTRLSQEQARFRSEIAETPSLLRRMSSALGPVASGMIAAFSIGSLVSGTMAAFGNAKRVIFEFEQGVADLSAITGASGKDLEFLKNAAIQLGESTKGGAVAVLEAYKLIASAKPELLNNVDALNQVTEATLILSKAAGMEMPAAATALTDAMNQFGVDASQASVFVDSLANGAKYGAAEIPQVTEALLKFGAIARSSNVDIKESTALIELLAENGLKGADAGTALRNILLKISAPDALPKEAQEIIGKLGISMEFLKDKTIPFQQKLEALKPLLVDNANVVKVFGLENTTAALNVISHTERLKELASKMGEVGTAEQQAAIKMDTVNNKTELLKSKYDSLILSIGTGKGVVSGFFKFFIDGASNALTGLIRLNSSWDELYSKAKADGQKTGASSFTRRFNSLAGTGSDADIAKSIKTVAERDYKMYEKQYREYENKKIELSKTLSSESDRKAFLAREFDPKLKEELTRNLAEQAAIIREARKKMNPPKPVTTENTTENTVVTGLSDKEQKAADAAAKKSEKQLSDAKKNAEDNLKIENDLQKSLNDSKAKADELKFGLIEDDFTRERALINAEFDKKIEDFELNIKKEQEAIDKLKSNIANPATSKDDLVSYKKQLKDRLEIQENYNQAMLSTDQTRDLKLGALQEKFLQKNIQDQEKANARDLLNLRTKQNNELASIQSLEDAKTILSQTLSADELAKIKTLEDAKKAVKEQHLKEEYDLQLTYLSSISTEYKNFLDGQTVDGFKILTAEQRDEILANLDAVANKISEIGVNKNNIDTTEVATNKPNLSGIDLLGFSMEQWQGAFDNLDSFDGKMQTLQTTVTGVQNAFGMYFQFLEAGERKNLQKFEANNRKRQDALSTQLEKGIITQEVYNARKEKLDADLAKKKAEIEYKQAKRERAIKAGSIIANTAMGIMQIWGHSPDPTGLSQATLTAIIAGIGALNLGLVMAQPLPDKNGFKAGGFTGYGPTDGVAGDVHFGEYVVPNKVLFSNDPVVPNIMGYLDAKKQGKTPQLQEDIGSSSTTSQGGSGSASTDMQVVYALNRNSAILEKLEDDGVQAYLVNDYQAAKKMRDKIKEVTKNETNAKP